MIFFGCTNICNSVFLLPTIWRSVVELRMWLTLNFCSLISTVYRSGVWVRSRTLIACSTTRCVKGFLSSTLSLLPMFLLTWQIQSCTRTLIFGNFVWHCVYKIYALFRWRNWRLSAMLWAFYSKGNFSLFSEKQNWSSNESKILSLSDHSLEGMDWRCRLGGWVVEVQREWF